MSDNNVIYDIAEDYGSLDDLLELIDELYNIFKAEYKMRTAKGFLK